MLETRPTHNASNRHSPQSQEQDSHDSGVLNGRAPVITQTGQDVSRAFSDGAQQALDSATRHGCRQALLKANISSCSNRQIHSSHFDQQLQPGSGVTAALLQRHGISVCDENEMDGLLLTKPQP
ncbi:2-thiouracil desulfurase family protein [Vogesella indigofera]|uniref:2-thiouracil desulfurase family protein n=1 Tax=Vogesella indigofera TaxID=45465 RepID=UPI0035AF367F